MASVTLNTTIKEYKAFINEVYGLSNARYFNTEGMLTNIQRFTMRGIKGIRKEDKEKTTLNLLIVLSWYMSLMNQLHIEIEDEIWKRFPYVCSYCVANPCSCKKDKVKKRKEPIINNEKRPKTLSQFQEMFEQIYPSDKRTLKDAGIHLAEELGELSEAIFKYRGQRKKEDFDKIALEAADFFSCLIGVYNSSNISVATELSEIFTQNCHVCRKAPCECSFSFIMDFKS